MVTQKISVKVATPNRSKFEFVLNQNDFLFVKKSGIWSTVYVVHVTSKDRVDKLQAIYLTIVSPAGM